MVDLGRSIKKGLEALEGGGGGVSSVGRTDWRTLHIAGFNCGTGNGENETVEG